ncbi:hypothetical protein F5B18DRAFT_654269 [Nemania serpens]|nr:hypothetical protein F5B18DRAFT_654269 [Nemania serpens]
MPKEIDHDLTKTQLWAVINAWGCLKSNPDIDLDKLAAFGGYTNVGSVQNNLRDAMKKIRARIDAEVATNDDATEGVVALQTPQKKRGRGNADAGRTPTPKKSRTGTSKAVAKNSGMKDQDRGQHEDQDEIKYEDEGEV